MCVRACVRACVSAGAHLRAFVCTFGRAYDASMMHFQTLNKSLTPIPPPSLSPSTCIAVSSIGTSIPYFHPILVSPQIEVDSDI
jgi:hypothetical protein